MSAKYKTRECEHIFKKLNLISTFPVTSKFFCWYTRDYISSRLDINYPGFRYLPQKYQFFDNLEQLCKLVRIPSILKINNACTIKTNAKWKNNYTMYIKNAFLKPLLFFILHFILIIIIIVLCWAISYIHLPVCFFLT